MVELTLNDFKEFRKFLKQNGIYTKFIECFEKQKFAPIYYHEKNPFIRHDFIKEVKNNKKEYAQYGALKLAFASFTWVNDQQHVPISFTKYWCTFIGVKWGIYCIKHDLSICDMYELSRLLRYWDSKTWIDRAMLSFEEKIILNQIISYYEPNLY